MAQDTRDVLMKIVLNNKAIDAESTALLDSKDPLCEGFVSASPSGTTKGNYFSIQDFNIELGLSAEDTSDADAEEANNRKRQLHTDKKFEVVKDMHEKLAQVVQQLIESHRALVEGKPATGDVASAGGKPMRQTSLGHSLTEFPRFMQGGAAAMRTRSYSSDLEPVQITKQLDLSSLKLFDICKSATLIDSATIIKRRGGGGDRLRTYMRIDFTEMLITDFGWQDDDVVKETFKFVCRKAQVTYSVANPDGTQRGAQKPGVWSYLNLGS